MALLIVLMEHVVNEIKWNIICRFEETKHYVLFLTVTCDQSRHVFLLSCVLRKKVFVIRALYIEKLIVWSQLGACWILQFIELYNS